MPRYPGRAREDFATHEIRDGSWLILGTPVRAPPRTRVAYSPVVPFTGGGNTPERATSQSRSRWTHTWQPRAHRHRSPASVSEGKRESNPLKAGNANSAFAGVAHG